MVKTIEEQMLLAEAEIQRLQEDARSRAMALSIMDIVQLAMQNDEFALNMATEQFFERSMVLALKELQNAIEQGYLSDLKAKQEIAKAEGGNLQITDFSLDDAEKQALYEWPLLGHTIQELATQLATNLLFDVRSALNGPTRGLFHVEQLPGHLEAAQLTFANNLATNISDAYTTGAQAAREIVKGALGAALS